MNERRWIDPNSDAPERVRAALAAFDAEPGPASRARGWARFRDPEERKTRPSWLAGGAAGLAVASLALAVAVTWPRSPELTALALTGEVAGAEGPIAPGASLRTPARVRVGARGRAVLQTAAGDTLRVASGTRIEVRREPGTLIELSTGLVDVEASPRHGADRLTVAAGRWRVEVVGTRFTVERRVDDRVRVEVSEGRVRVVGPGHDDHLGPGEVFESRTAPASSSEARPASASEALEAPRQARARRGAARPEAARAARRGSTADRPRTAARDASRAPQPAPAGAAEIALEDAPDQATETPPVPAPREAAAAVGGPLGDGPAGAAPELGPARALTEAPSAPRTAPIPGSPRLAERASARRSEPAPERSDPREPSVIRDPATGEVAAYRAARALKDAGRTAEAAASYGALIDRWPSGELTLVASLDRIECLLAEGDAAAARDAERRLLHAHPAAASRPEVAFVLAEVARALGEHADAAALYSVAARADRFSEPAGFLEAVSHARAGDTKKATEAMRAYLERYPTGPNADAARRALEERRR